MYSKCSKVSVIQKGTYMLVFPTVFFCIFFRNSDSDSTSSFSRYESERKGRAQAMNNVFFFLSIVSKALLGI
jgi:hypothetical protein